MTEQLRQLLAARIRHQDIPLFGVAPADRWNTAPFEPWVPKEFRPRSIYPECESVIVIGYPISLPVIETTPSIYYHEMYKTVNTLLDQSAYRLSLFLNEQGHAAFPIPRDGYAGLSVLKERPMAAFSHKHAAYLAGLGTFGRNNTLLTKRFGPRVRFTSIFTTARMPYDGVLKEDLCIKCDRCVDMCPVKAIPGQDYPQGIIDKALCTGHHERLYSRSISPCGVCVKVCPVGEDRKLYGREDASIYQEKEGEPHAEGWKHVRSYGGKKG
ncbi:MAG: ferredoxin [Methanomassiliicoccales archaeon PtaU1.Bin124]|nr:MAG: ferredoxin [Methanomassiliicoccales archaeon PtaU1.Bin124]